MMFGGEEELNIEFINVAINPNLTWKYWLKCHLYWIFHDIFVLLRLKRLFTPRPIFLLFCCTNRSRFLVYGTSCPFI